MKLKTVRPEYDFSKFAYKGAAKKGTAICPKHGHFLTTYDSIIGGHGCPACKGDMQRDSRLKSPELAIAEMRSKAPQFDYSKYVFTGVKVKGVIICPIHGEFLATHGAVMRGRGCPACGKVASGLKSRLNGAEAISRMQKCQPNYDYSKFTYATNTSKSTAICPTHGEFQVSYRDVVDGRGCKVCSRQAQSLTSRVPFQEFIKRLREVHGGTFTCKKDTYSGVSENVIATCPVHGDFRVLAGSLLNGQGCPDCKDSRFNPKKRAYFYLYRISDGVSSYLGFGITTNLYRRCKEHAIRLNGKPYSGELIHSFRFRRGYQCQTLESQLKGNLAITPLQVRGFKTEACRWDMYHTVLRVVQEWHDMHGSDNTIYK